MANFNKKLSSTFLKENKEKCKEKQFLEPFRLSICREKHRFFKKV